MKNILGLDIGTNSVGFALIEENEGQYQRIIKAGSRIIPMGQDEISDFNKGNTVTAAAQRRQYRSMRRNKMRRKLRRERIHRMLHSYQMLPAHYDMSIGWDKNDAKHYGQFLEGLEPKLPWIPINKNQSKFLFFNRFENMLQDFKRVHPDFDTENKKIPLDWTIYYLRKIGLTQRLTLEELAWVILQFNQKRGYYQLSMDDATDDATKKQEIKELEVLDVEDLGINKGTREYRVVLPEGLEQIVKSNQPLNWKGEIRTFIVTWTVDAEENKQTDKEGKIKYSIKQLDPEAADAPFALIKQYTEIQIEDSGLHVGEYIYNSLLHNPEKPIIGKLVATIDRHHYRRELEAILQAQVAFHPELQDHVLFDKAVEELYPNNFSHRLSLQAHRSFVKFVVEDIVFYQRPLKSKKSTISNCPLEAREYIDKETGEFVTVPIKCIPKSHPLYQEFRLWQFVYNIRFKSVEIASKKDSDVTAQFLSTPAQYATYFDWLNTKDSIKGSQLLACPSFKLKPKERKAYECNYLEDKTYPCNKTAALYYKLLKKAGIDVEVLEEVESNWMTKLWHILYSVTDLEQREKALGSYAEKMQFSEEDTSNFVTVFKQAQAGEEGYGAYSEKAIKKLLTLMRTGYHWDLSSNDKVLSVVEEWLETGECPKYKNLSDNLREQATSQVTSRGFKEVNDFQGVPFWVASYILYGRHSEASNAKKWKNTRDLNVFLAEFKQNDMRNPVVQNIVRETLLVVRDLWKAYDHIDEIHVELGREMKNSADKRKAMTARIEENENKNLRIRRMLQEFQNASYGVEQVRAHSPMQAEALSIYEEGAIANGGEMPKEVFAIHKKLADSSKVPTASEFMRYKLWLDQRYQSPYTGQIIPLSKLFTSAYEIEHVIPKSRFYDDSFTNKVICESAVNKDKDNMLAMEYIQSRQGKEIACGSKLVPILTPEQYEHHINEVYGRRNRLKAEKLTITEIPDSFIERQLNDTRYISKYVMALLSNIVREDGEETSTSKNLIPCTGGITTRLKKDWGLNDIWNSLIAPRFQRMNELEKTNAYGEYREVDGKRFFQINIPLDIAKGFNKKRIDHRHHALDAIIVACASRRHVQFLNSQEAKSNPKNHDALKEALMVSKGKGNGKGLRTPWPTFTKDVLDCLQNIVPSFKHKARVVSRGSNYTEYIDATGRKATKKQTKGDLWTVRKPLHKETIYGRVNRLIQEELPLKKAVDHIDWIVDKEFAAFLQELVDQKKKPAAIVKAVKEHEKYEQYAVAVPVNYYSDELEDETKHLVVVRKSLIDLGDSLKRNSIEDDIMDGAIRRILLNHLDKYMDGDTDHPELAFSADGVNELNKHIIELNGGVFHHPINKVRVTTVKGQKFKISDSCGGSKHAIAAPDTNLFYAVYLNEKGKREYATIPFYEALHCKQEKLPVVPEINENGAKLLFTISPNDLVYMLEDGQNLEDIKSIKDIKKNRLYKFVSSYGNRSMFIPVAVSSVIKDKVEYQKLNKIELDDEKMSIKTHCYPLQTDRLGNIIAINNIKLD